VVRSGEHRLTPCESVDALVVFLVRRRAVLPACMLVLVAGCSSAADDEPPLTDGSLGQGIIGQQRAATAYTEGCPPPPTASRSIPAARGPSPRRSPRAARRCSPRTASRRWTPSSYLLDRSSYESHTEVHDVALIYLPSASASASVIMTRFRGHPNSAAWAGVPDAGAASLALVNDLPGASGDLSSDTPPRRREPGRRRSQRA